MKPSDRIVRLHTIFRDGSSAPACVETQSGEAFVLKFRGAGGGTRALATEMIGLGVAALLGVRVPAARPIYLPADFPWQVGTDEFHDIVTRSAGWNLGVAYVAHAAPARENDLAALPAAFLAPLARADALLVNVDRPRGNANILIDASGPWAIDFDACLFFSRLIAGAAARSPWLPDRHFLSGSRFDAHDVPTLSAEAVTTVVRETPEEWFGGLPLSRATFGERLAAYCG